MAYTGTLIKINGITLPKVKSFKTGRNKFWKDAERNMQGELRSTLIGVFPKLEVEFSITTESEISTIVALLDNAYFTVQYFDVRSKSLKSAQYYCADYSVELFSKSRGLYAPFKVSLIPVRKAVY